MHLTRLYIEEYIQGLAYKTLHAEKELLKDYDGFANLSDFPLLVGWIADNQNPKESCTGTPRDRLDERFVMRLRHTMENLFPANWNQLERMVARLGARNMTTYAHGLLLLHIPRAKETNSTALMRINPPDNR